MNSIFANLVACLDVTWQVSYRKEKNLRSNANSFLLPSAPRHYLMSECLKRHSKENKKVFTQK
jgi:hypothetical protein